MKQKFLQCAWVLAFFASALILNAQGHAYGKNRVTICHNGQTIQVPPNVVNLHLGHGDQLGPCPDDCIDQALINPNVLCTQQYDPVCGCDGVTYPNSCIAINHYGVTSYTLGPCPDDCIDQALINPNVLCTQQYDPVCGCDGVTYPNSCIAINHYGVTSYTLGPCLPAGCIDQAQIDLNVLCTQQYDPVCGCDGVTYPNSCIATNHYGVTSYTLGPCPAGARMSKGSNQNYFSIAPNPAQNNPEIQWAIEENGNVSLEVFDFTGKKVAALFSGPAEGGLLYNSTFQTEELPKGVYFVRLSGTKFDQTYKLILQ